MFPWNIILPQDKEGTIFEDGPFDQGSEERAQRRSEEFYRRQREEDERKRKREDSEEYRWNDDE